MRGGGEAVGVATRQLRAPQIAPGAVQICPPEHSGAVPHRHTPSGEQTLAVRAPQALQVPPGAAQAAAERVRHELPAQQPVGHDCASHTQAPLTQR